MKKKSATHTTKHKGTSKHAATAKHKAHEEHLAHEAHEAHLAHEGKVHAVAKPAKPKKPAKARSLAVGDALPVCSFEALAMSLRLAGQFVHDDEVAALWLLAGAPPLGASLAAALDAANLHGLAGFRPQRTRLRLEGPHAPDRFPLPVGQQVAAGVGPVDDLLAGDFHGLGQRGQRVIEAGDLAAAGAVRLKVGGSGARIVRDLADVTDRAALAPAEDREPRIVVGGASDVLGGYRRPSGAEVHALILGLELPGPHAVLATADGWWSWGELHDPAEWPDAVAEEAWAVSWS